MAAPARKTVSGNALVNSLIDGGYYWDDGRNGGAAQIKVFYEGGNLLPGVPFTFRWEEKAIRRGLDAWEAVAAVKFTDVATPLRADISILVTTPDDDPELRSEDGTIFGYMESPSDTGRNGRSDGAFNYFAEGWDNLGGLRPGGFGFNVILHEIGHALGLAHPFDEGQSGRAGIVEDLNNIPTLMEYRDYRLGRDGYVDPFRGADWPYAYDSGNPATPGPMDIAAIQHLYGANLDADDGDGDGHPDDVYRLPVSDADWRTIWDTGGVDWIVNPGGRECRIDLRPAVFGRRADLDDDAVWSGGGFGQVRGVLGGVLIADDFTRALPTARGPEAFRGVLIENARGGGGADRLDGNAAANTLVGRGGADRIAGMGGDDALKGGPGADTLIGGPGRDVLTGGAGFDDYVYTRIAHSGPRRADRDLISDFDGNRREDIDLSRIDADPFRDRDQAFAFLGRRDFDAEGAASAGQLRYETVGDHRLRLEADVDGDGAADFAVTVLGVGALQQNDFLL